MYCCDPLEIQETEMEWFKEISINIKEHDRLIIELIYFLQWREYKLELCCDYHRPSRTIEI